MVSINKYLTIAIVASVLIGAAFAQTAEPATEAPVPEGAAQSPGFIGGLGSKLISGLKNAGKAVFSHVPFLNHGAGAAATTNNPVEEMTDAVTTTASVVEATSASAPVEATSSSAPAEATTTVNSGPEATSASETTTEKQKSE